MIPEDQSQIIQILYNIGSWFAGIISAYITAYIINYVRPKQVKEDEKRSREDEHDKHQNETIAIQGQTLADAWKSIRELEKRDRQRQAEIASLRDELDKWRKAYARAMRWIQDTTPPDVKIPNFLTDTGELNKKQ